MVESYNLRVEIPIVVSERCTNMAAAPSLNKLFAEEVLAVHVVGINWDRGPTLPEAPPLNWFIGRIAPTR